MPLTHCMRNFLFRLFIFLIPGYFLPRSVNAQTTDYFIENLGQFHENVKFKMKLDAGYLFLEDQGLTYSFYDEQALDEIWNHRHEESRTAPVTVPFHAVKMRILNAEKADLNGKESLLTYHNYYLGKSSEKWRSKVPLHREVQYQNIYRGIDWRIFTQNGALKNEWIVHPGAEPEKIGMLYLGHDGMFIENGKLVVKTSVNEWTESKPFAYQVLDGKKVEVDCRYQMNGDKVSFIIAPLHDPSKDLVIDPVLVFSTYSGSKGDNFGFTATYDSKSNLYAGGVTDNASGEYPVTTGAFQRTWGGGVGTFPVNLACDISISKYDSSGSNLLYATYLGGEQDEYPHSLVVDNNDRLLVMGTTNSSQFPVTKKAFDTLINGQYDIIVSKFSEDGSQLIGSTYFGGTRNDGLNSGTLRYNYADDFRGDIIVDDANHVFIASTTLSSDLPLKQAIQGSSGGGYDGCLAEFNDDLSQLLWCSYAGAEGSDALYSIKLNAESIFAAGGTNSQKLDTTEGVLFEQNQGDFDGFIVKINKTSKALDKLSYWGTSEYDQIYFIDLDARNTLYVTGQTEGSTNPSSGTYGKKDKGQFVARMSLDLDSLYWQTSFGNRDKKPDISPSAFLVDKCNHIYISGWGSNVRPDLNPGTTAGLEITSDAVQKTTDNNDFYIMVLDQDAKGLLYATYFGGYDTDDHVDGGTSRFDKRGVIYQSVCSSCPNGSEPGHNDFPVTPKAAFVANVSPRCSNASFKIDLQIKEAVIAQFAANPRQGCRPLTVDFTNLSTPGRKYYWDFGDGSSDSVFSPPIHTYDKPGIYKVILTAVDSLSCNISDRYSLDLVVYDKPEADFEYKFNGCNDQLTLTNKTKDGRAYFWDFGDGDTSRDDNPKHQYTQSGSYRITLIASPDESCPDTFFKDVPINVDANSEFIIPNVFTPDDDGKNDCFGMEGLQEDCDEIEWIIYNRWGERVFYSRDMKACWDGKDKLGHPYPAGAYFAIYYIRFGNGNGKETISGTVTLIR